MRARYWIRVVTIALIGPVAGVTLMAQERPGQVDRVSRGAELYAAYCQRCHNPRGPAERTDREWMIVMQHMETRANMTVERASAVLAFLLASNDPARLPGTARTGLTPTPTVDQIDDEMLEAGRRVFRGTGGCAACHGRDLDGTPIAPSLRDAVWKHGDGSLSSILNLVRNGVAGSVMTPYPAGISDEMAVQAAAYVWAVSRGRVEQ